MGREGKRKLLSGSSTCCFSHSQSISLVWAGERLKCPAPLWSWGRDLQASERHSTCWALHKALFMAVWAAPFASHWKCCLAHQHMQLKNKRGKTSACLFKMLSKRREAWDLREKGRLEWSNLQHPPPPAPTNTHGNLSVKLLFQKSLKEGAGVALKEAFMSAKM